MTSEIEKGAEREMELELGLALPTGGLGFDLNSPTNSASSSNNNKNNKKRGLSEAFGDDEEEEGEVINTTAIITSADRGGCRRTGGGELVGWPPVKYSARMMSTAADTSGCNNGSKLVKVNMEGAAIGRKVDLSHHHSYQSLLHTLDQMFGKNHGELDQKKIGGSDGDLASGEDEAILHMVTYQDGDGDWMLAGDVPWKTFIGSVKRLKIMNINSSNQAL